MRQNEHADESDPNVSAKPSRRRVLGALGAGTSSTAPIPDSNTCSFVFAHGNTRDACDFLERGLAPR